MNDRTLEKLEFHKILALLAKECATAMGKQKVAELKPVREIDRVREWQEATSEAKTILRLNPLFHLGGIFDIRQDIEMAEKNGTLDGSKLLEIMTTCQSARRIKLILTQMKESYPIVQAIGSEIAFLNSLETAIEEAVGDDGQVLDGASGELSDLRRKIRVTAGRIKDKMDGIIKNPNQNKYLQDPIITIRNDRYVVPVKQEYRNQVPGLIHDQSASGATLFIEPMAVLEMNNDVKRLRAAEEEEMRRILRQLSRLVAMNGRELKYNLDALAQLDFIFAKGRLSTHWDGFAPKLNQEGRLHLKKARHPLLGDKAVPIDLLMEEELAAVIITGPNTGGKTVSLKIAGLFVLMAQAGLHLPVAEGSEAPVFHGVYADIGDEQSIEQSLSTFSSHMVNIVEILAKAGKNNLVLLDELGAGTDPVEGAALAMAVIDTLLQKGAKMIVTTHYSELKAYAYNHPKLANASVEFDIDTLRPTYRLLMGVPGRSNAFDIALSLGLSDRVIAKADEYMSKEAKEVQNFLANLETNRAAAERAKEEAESLKSRMEALEQQIKRRERELQQRESQMLDKARSRAESLLREKKREADALLAQLKDMLAQENARKQEELLRQAREKARRIDDMAPGWETPDFGGEKVEKLNPGDEVYIPRLKKNGTVLEVLNAGEVQIQAGIMKVKMSVKELRRPQGSQKETAKSRYSHLTAVKAKEAKSELDLRGLSGEEAKGELEKFLDDAFLGNLPSVRIIHGVGTGVLKKMVNEILQTHPHVLSHRLGGYYEGGAGVSIAQLRKEDEM